VITCLYVASLSSYCVPPAQGTKIGQSSLSVNAFRQMCGRAGRLGLDASGQAVLMINDGPAERAAAAALVAKDLDPLASRLHDARGGGLHKLLLEMVCLGRLRRVGDVPAFTQVGLVAQWSARLAPVQAVISFHPLPSLSSLSSAR